MNGSEQGAGPFDDIPDEFVSQISERCRKICEGYTGAVQAKTLGVVDVTTWLNEQLPQTEQIVEGGILPQNSIALIGGIAKLGKSMFALNLSIQLATGRPLLSMFNIPRARRVFYIQAEISAAEMQGRLRTMLEATGETIPEGGLLLLNERGLKLDRADDFQLIDDYIKEHDIEVLVLDPLYKFHGGDENSVKDMTGLLDRFDALVKGNNMGMVVVHHFGKPNENLGGLTRFRGSSTIIDYADAYLMLTKKGGDEKGRFKLSFELRNAQQPEPLTLIRNPDTLWYEVVPEEGPKVQTTDVVLALHALGGKSKNQQSIIDMVASECDASRRTVNMVVQQAIDEGKILTLDIKGRGKPKYYFLPDRQEEVARELQEQPELFKEAAVNANI